jgi:hypothetical protein
VKGAADGVASSSVREATCAACGKAAGREGHVLGFRIAGWRRYVLFMSCVLVRQAAVTDRARILEISSQIWDGNDYVPEVLDAWFADAEGELVVATLDGHVIAFAHRSWLCPKVA